MAVGVVDVLPRCLSSAYLFWDPDWASLGLGKLTALKEIAWVQAASARCPALQWYHMVGATAKGHLHTGCCTCACIPHVEAVGPKRSLLTSPGLPGTWLQPAGLLQWYSMRGHQNLVPQESSVGLCPLYALSFATCSHDAGGEQVVSSRHA